MAPRIAREKQRRREGNPHEQLLQKTVKHARALHESVLKLRASVEERERHFHDAQDGLVQRIYAIGLVLDRARGHAARDANLVERTIVRCIEQLNSVIRDLREQIAHNVKKGILKPASEAHVKYSWRGMIYLWCQFLLDLVRL